MSEFPKLTKFEIIPLDDVKVPIVCFGLEYWDRVRRSRAFPSRDELQARELGTALPYMVLIGVLDGGDDFLLKIVGDEVCRSYRAPLNQRRASEIAIELPNSAQRWLPLYRQVAVTGIPIAIRLSVGLEAPEINFTEAETVCLPLGPRQDCVDHLVTFGKHLSRTDAFRR